MTGLESSMSNAEPEGSSAGQARIESLTGLRWFAALAVFFSHFPLPGGPSWLRMIYANGYMGVTVFFVLSGFILTVNYGSRLSTPSLPGIWNFAVARIARVYPTYILVLCYVFFLTQQRGGDLHNWLPHVFALQAWSGSLGTAFNFNGPGWSVGVEFLLYACFPALIFLLAPVLRRSAIDCLIVASTVALAMVGAVIFFHEKRLDALPLGDPNSAHRWLYVMPATRVGDFLLGICAAYLFLIARERPPRVWVTLACETGLVVGILGMMSQRSIYLSAGSFDVDYAVPAAILLWFLAVRPNVGLGRFLALPFVVALGEASYAFYLIHVPIKDQFLGASAVAGGTIDNLSVDCLELALVTALAWGIHVGFERPARRVIRKTFAYRGKPRVDPLRGRVKPASEAA